MNEQTATPEPTEAELLTENQRLQRQMIVHENRLLKESLDHLDRWIDPLDAVRDSVTGEIWNVVGRMGIGGGAAMQNQPTTDRAGFRDQYELDIARDVCRWLAELSQFAINIIRNRISYVVGVGHKYNVVVRKGKKCDPADVVKVQEWLDEWVKRNRWSERQQEIQRRRDRDGEAFLQLSPSLDGYLKVRFIEPWQVQQPQNAGKQDFLGIRTADDDVETIEGYWIDGDLIEPDRIQHRKANVDLNVRRGQPTLWPIRELLRKAEKIIVKIAAKIDIQAAFALLRSRPGATAQQASTARAANAQPGGIDRNGVTRWTQSMKAGQIVDVPNANDYQFPPMVGGQVADAVAGLQAVARVIASAVVMPEYMVTSDASNGTYSSTLVAGDPATKNFEGLQAESIRDDLAVIDRAMANAEEQGLLPKGVREFVEVQATAPQLVARNQKEETDKRATLCDKGVLSRQTWSAEESLDYEQEQRNIADDRKRNPVSVDAGPAFNPVLPAPVAPRPESQPPQAAGGTEAVQDTALNGAQIASLLSITDQVRLGQLSRPAATEILKAAFPVMDQPRIERIVNAIEVKPPIEPVVTPPAPTAQDRLAEQLDLMRADRERWRGYP